MINIKMQPTEVQKLSPKITVIGVGGAGGNAVNNMISSGLEGCEFLVCNTDAQALQGSLCQNRVQLGTTVTGGLGAGSKPEVGRAAAEESLEDVMEFLDGANMVFVTAGMGGGTGTGAAPYIAKACRERGILTVGVVTKPFHFEGSHRMKSADKGIEEMQDFVDTLIVIPNQNLFRVANEKVSFADAFRMVDGVLQSGVQGVTDLMVRPGLINLDFADIRTAMLEMGKAMMGTGEASGDKRAIQAAEAAINNPLLDDVSMKGARGLIVNVTGGYDMTLFEADEACNRIRDEVDPDANIIFGATFDEGMDGKMRVSIVATGIDKEAEEKRRSGGGSLRTDATGKGLTERARPNTDVAPTATAHPAQPGLPVQPSMPVFVPASQAIRGIQAPPAAPVPVAPPRAAAPHDPEQDLFEQNGFSEPAAEEAAVPQNTAMRGTRYGNSFIPPKPIEAGNPAPSYYGAPPAYASAASSPPGLKLNPPRQPAQAEKKRSPSLFERITGTVQQHIEGLRDDYQQQHQPPRQRVAPSPGFAAEGAFHQQQAAPPRPSQGSLNIDAPAKAQVDDELDIPAFLRRQAN